MPDYVKVFKTEKYVEACLYLDHEKPLSLMEPVEAACPEAYMNGYNWEALLRYYLEQNAPDILEGMGTDPEAGMYAAYWPLSPENEERAGRLAEIIRSLVEDGEALCRFVQEHSEEIEWD